MIFPINFSCFQCYKITKREFRTMNSGKKLPIINYLGRFCGFNSTIVKASWPSTVTPKKNIQEFLRSCLIWGRRHAGSDQIPSHTPNLQLTLHQLLAGVQALPPANVPPLPQRPSSSAASLGGSGRQSLNRGVHFTKGKSKHDNRNELHM